MVEFLTVGEPLVVLASEDVDENLVNARHFTKFVAGAELNVALGIQRLEHETAYISKLGDDPFGKFISDSAKSSGIDVSNLKVDENFLTGFYLKEKVSQGDPRTAYFRKNSAASNLTVKEIDTVDLTDVKIAHLSGIFAALSETALETFKAFNKKLNEVEILTIFDPNLRPALWGSREFMVQTTNELAKNSRIVLPGINEGEILMGSREPEEIADFYLDQSDLTHTAVVKLGADGAFIKSKSGEKLIVSGFKVKNIVDTVGAGDGFAVGLESALLEGRSIKAAIHRACAVGALAVQTPGDNDGYPTREQLKKFYKNNNYKGDI